MKMTEGNEVIAEVVHSHIVVWCRLVRPSVT